MRAADTAGMRREDGRGTGDGRRATGDGQWGSELVVGADIAVRLLDLATGVLRVVKTMPRDAVSRHVALQLVRAATSAGANYEEARGAESRADFIHKVGIAAKEVRETTYWLRLVERAQLTSLALSSFHSETRQLAAILMASMRTARSKLT